MVVPMHGNAPIRSPEYGNSVIDSDQIAYTVKHGARVVDISERQMWELIRKGEVESVKIGRSRRIPRVALVAYIERLRAESQVAAT